MVIRLLQQEVPHLNIVNRQLNMETTHSVDVSPSLSKFAVSLFKVISKNVGPSSNVCVSPFSVATVIAMAHVGARGDTAKQITNVLHLNEFEEDEASKAIGELCNNIKVDFGWLQFFSTEMFSNFFFLE